MVNNILIDGEEEAGDRRQEGAEGGRGPRPGEREREFSVERGGRGDGDWCLVW